VALPVAWLVAWLVAWQVAWRVAWRVVMAKGSDMLVLAKHRIEIEGGQAAIDGKISRAGGNPRRNRAGWRGSRERPRGSTAREAFSTRAGWRWEKSGRCGRYDASSRTYGELRHDRFIRTDNRLVRFLPDHCDG
jgi:hypothetical protein